MSLVQYAALCGKRILLTADACRGALSEAADYAPAAGLTLPGVQWFKGSAELLLAVYPTGDCGRR